MSIGEQIFELVSVNSSKVLDVSGASLEDGAPVIQYTSHNSPNQQWYLKTLGEVGGQEAFYIVNRNSGKVLDVSGASLDAGATLQQQTASGAASQQWYLNPLGNLNWQEFYEIVNVGSGLVVDVSGGSTDDGAAVEQWPFNGGSNQQWILQAVAVPNDVQLVVEKKFMQNYRTATPVNGGADVVPVYTSGGQIQLFTIGSDNNVHTFYPDSTSETGYSETVVTTGILVNALAAGLDSQGKVVVFVGSGPALYYFTETSAEGSSWSAPQKVTAADWQVPQGATDISAIIPQEIAGNLYVAIIWAIGTGQYTVSYSTWQTDAPIFLLPANRPLFDNLQFVWLGNSADTVAWANFPLGALYSYNLATKQASNDATTPKLDVLDVGSALDATGANQTVAVLADGNAYRLVAGAEQGGVPQYSWQPLADWQDTDQQIRFQEMIVEIDSNGAAQLFSVSSPRKISADDPTYYNELYHWLADTASPTGYATPPTPLYKSIGMQVGYVGNDHGSIELFAVDSSGLVTHLFEEQESGNWAVQAIETGSGDIEEYPSYSTDVTVYDSLGALAVNVPFSITSSEETRITANGGTFFIDAQRAALVSTNAAGIVSIAQSTNSLAIPSLQINVPSLMTSEPSIAIQPSADVQAQLATVTGDDLMNATVEDGSYLLADEYRTPETTDSLAISINQCMDMVGTPALAATAHPTLARRGPKHGVWHRPSGLASDLRRISPSHHKGQHWQLSREGNKLIYRALTAHQAAELRAQKRATLPTGMWDFFDDVGDFVEGVVDDIIDVVDTIVDEVEGAINATITFIVDGVEYVFETVIEYVEQAFDMVELLFAMVKVFFEMLYQWLAWLFGWPKILYTKDAIAYTINQLLLFLEGAAPAIQAQVDSGFDSLEQQIASIFNQAVNSLVGIETVGGYEQSSQQSDPQLDTATSNNFLYTQFINHVTQATGGPSLAQALAIDDPSSAFSQQLNDFASMLEGTEAFTAMVGYFQNLGSNPDQIFNLLLASMMQLVQGLVEAGVSSMQALIDSLMGLMPTIISAVQSTFNEPWNIPFVSQFYKWLTGDTLTTLDLVSLILAIPATIFYVLQHGSYPFSSSGDLDTFTSSFNAQMMLAASGLAQPSPRLASDPPKINLPTGVKDTLISFYAVGTFCATLLTAESDSYMPPGTTPRVVTYVSYLCTALALCARFPWFFSSEDLNCETSGGQFNWLWLDYCIGLALAGFAFYVTNEVNANNFVLIMSASGAASLGLAISASVAEPDQVKQMWMIIPTLPMAGKVLRHPAVAGFTGDMSVGVLLGMDIACGIAGMVLGCLVLTE